MVTQPIQDLKKLCIHTITTRPWPLSDAIRHFAAAGVAGISVWRQAIEGQDPAQAGRAQEYFNYINRARAEQIEAFPQRVGSWPDSYLV